MAYTWHFDPGSLTTSITGVWRDQQNGALFDRFYDNAPSWYDIDLRALWKGPNDKYEIIAYVKNLTNTLQYAAWQCGRGAGGERTSSVGQFRNQHLLIWPRRALTAWKSATSSSSRSKLGQSARAARLRRRRAFCFS